MLYRGLVFFLILAAMSWVLITQFNVPYGTVDYFDRHGLFFLVAITFFPRLTLLFSSIVSGGLVWWLSWLFFPRVLVATLATFAYFQTNPILVTISWLVAFGGESFEKRSIRNSRVVFRTFRTANVNPSNGPRMGAQKPINKDDVIDVEFKKL